MDEFEKADLSDAERELSAEIRARRSSIVKEGKEEIDALLAGNYDGATTVRIDRIEPVIDRMDETTTELVEHRRKAAEAHRRIRA